MECFNNLVMLNNASLFYRLEKGRSPESLTDLATGRFADTSKIVCPHGGAYAWDAKHDACTCSLHNRLRYLTPNLELNVLTTSDAERREYERYKERYERFWGTPFDPIAVRMTVGPDGQAGDVRAADCARQHLSVAPRLTRREAASARYVARRQVGRGVVRGRARPQKHRRRAAQACRAWPTRWPPIRRSPT